MITRFRTRRLLRQVDAVLAKGTRQLDVAMWNLPHMRNQIRDLVALLDQDRTEGAAETTAITNLLEFVEASGWDQRELQVLAVTALSMVCDSPREPAK